ncbi:ABC transporter permease [Brevibacterium sp. 50QC2O2]|uniref:ABC transporter permease n=1 Tax=Brevibacterium sp. 50QC2O2 TaxID=2968459 RepID=UPI00211BC597|nr:ABC transporter permease [Brevibacterium sp. 50QC2O2]MCQ9389564.1 ABC transporter permease [Brevibacterium sp. 50QC2O2]
MLMLTVRRLVAAIPTLIGVTLVLFLVLRVLAGDPVTVLLAGGQSTPEVEAELRQQFGLDKPLWLQYLVFVGGIFKGDLGLSYATRLPVADLLLGQILPTLALALSAAVVSALIGIILGSLAAMFKGSWVDSVIRVISLLNTSMPSFWVGLLLIVVFAFGLGWFPATGSDGFNTLVLPAIALGLSAAGTVARLVRNSVVDVLGENFVTALHAKGLSMGAIVVKHVLRNAIIPTVTIVGLQLGNLVAGAVIVEAVFSRQGLGQMLVQGVASSDFPVIQAVVLVIAVIYILINILVDLSYAVIDPRVKTATSN